jgi:hypothetical protein
MRQVVLSFFLLLSVHAFAQKDSVPLMPAYDTVYYGGLDMDRFCVREKRRANFDVHYNKVYFIEVGKRAPRYVQYMQQVCKPYNLMYYFMPEGKLGYAGFNAMRCYIAAMDSLVKAKYGADIKTIVYHRADSCYFANLATDTVNVLYCNTQASLTATGIVEGAHGEIFHVTCDSALYHTFKKLSSPIAEPIMMVNLLVEATGKVSQYKLNDFESDGTLYYADTIKHSKVYDGCGAAFWQLALNNLQTYTKWKPATVDTTHVRTWHNVEVIFEEKKP